MAFSHAVDRARADFESLPRLELSIPQAVRLWGLGLDDCRSVLDALVDEGVVQWTFKRTVVRASGQALSAPQVFYGSARSSDTHATSVTSAA